ncbi:Bardet-Biedl syndrome 10 protein homolog [Coregonus clupeaformis]|uniref:Bardet-Biedl syndrome 10 protein homolog n=1 Tax=Coregonus clupeaformis TaxID=59861 RepID=UPI001E1C3080|nr:Bardet-Biedl syndrome 10 protein homolog [Coregonus clupeaformis]
MRLQPQCLQLESVLQTVSVLEAVIGRSFGPDGGQMVVECVRRHSSVTGDGSKTFVLLLASLLREIQKHPEKPPGSGSTWLSDTHNPGQTDTHTLCRLLSAFLHTRISPTHAEIISQLTCELLSDWSCHGDFVNEHFPALHTAVSGFPIGCSHLLEGQVIHADFSTPLPLRGHGPIRALVVTEPLEPSLLIGGTVLELGGVNRGIESVCVRSGRGLESECVILQHLGVSLLLSSVRQSEAILAAAGRYGVCVLECVCEEDLNFFSLLSGAQPVSDWAVIGQEHVATVTFCRPLVLGAHRFVNVGFPKPEDRGRTHSLVVCGLTEGQTEQSVCAVRDALHMLHTTWGPTHRTRATDRTAYTHTDTHTDTNTRTDVMEPCRVLSVGGTFKFLLHHTLLQHTHANKDTHTPSNTDTHTLSHLDTSAISGMLAEALLSVPRQIYSHNPRRYLEAHAHTLSCIRKHGNSPDTPETSAVLAADGSNMVQADTGSGSMSGSGSGSGVKVVSVGSSSGSSSGVESVSCKYQLILAVLQCLRSLLSVDTVLHTNTSHTCQREEEEDDD